MTIITDESLAEAYIAEHRGYDVDEHFRECMRWTFLAALRIQRERDAVKADTLIAQYERDGEVVWHGTLEQKITTARLLAKSIRAGDLGSRIAQAIEIDGAG